VTRGEVLRGLRLLTFTFFAGVAVALTLFEGAAGCR
jgi:hypothetical protein